MCASDPTTRALDATAAIDTTMITLGKAATTFANSNQLIGFQAVNKNQLTMINFPRPAAGVGGGHYRKPSQFWSVNPKSANLEESIKYVSFFINDIEAGKALGVERGIPCSKAVRDAISPMLQAQDLEAPELRVEFGRHPRCAAAVAAGRRRRSRNAAQHHGPRRSPSARPRRKTPVPLSSRKRPTSWRAPRPTAETGMTARSISAAGASERAVHPLRLVPHLDRERGGLSVPLAVVHRLFSGSRSHRS